MATSDSAGEPSPVETENAEVKQVASSVPQEMEAAVAEKPTSEMYPCHICYPATQNTYTIPTVDVGDFINTIAPSVLPVEDVSSQPADVAVSKRSSVDELLDAYEDTGR